MEKFDTPLAVGSRALLASVFILSGLSKIGAFAGIQAYMQAYGVPPVLLAPTIAFEIGAGLALVVGIQTRIAAFLLAGFTILTALVFHTDFADQIQTILFLKNVSIVGGLLLLIRNGAGAFSVDTGFGRKAVTS